MKKKVYLLFDYFPTLQTGGLVATYARLVELLKEEYEFVILSAFNCEQNYSDQFNNVKIINLSRFKTDMRIRYIIINLRDGHLLGALKVIFSLILYVIYAPFIRSRVDKIVKENDVLLAVSPVAARFAPKNKRFILEIHTFFEYFFGSNLVGNLEAKLMTEPELILFRTKADADKAKRVKRYKNVSYIYNFFDDKLISKQVDIENERRKNRIIFIGRLVQSKDPMRLIECAKLLKKEKDDFILDIYGTGDLEEKIRCKIKDYDLEKNVFLKGFIDDKSIYNKYALQWMTSKFEGLSLTVVEAKANGVPTVSTNCGDGVYEVINDGQDGYIIKSNEELVEKTIRILDDDFVRKQLSYNAYKNFEKFNAKTAKKAWIKILNRF